MGHACGSGRTLYTDANAYKFTLTAWVISPTGHRSFKSCHNIMWDVAAGEHLVSNFER